MRKGLATLLLLATLTGCSGAAGLSDEKPAAVVDTRLAKANVRFGLDLLRHVYRGANAFLSPASASLVLSLTAGGARGETQAEMLKALRFDGIPMQDVHQGNQALQSILRNPDPQVEIAMANAIWHRTDLKAAPAFVSEAKQHYGATVDEAAFGTEEATKKINDWTSDATRGRIPQLFKSLGGNTVMVLVNALYFKGEWTHAFDPQRTADGLFTKADGTQESVPYMQQDGQFGALQGDGFRAVRLPYGQERVAMYLFVPDDLPAFVDGLTAERWEEYMGAFKPQQGLVMLPKVKLEATHPLNEPMQKMGLNLAFSPGQADFSGLFEDGRKGVAIDQILQKSFLEMNEQGTEAAAATGVVMTESAAAEPLLRADRPFLLAIRDDQTGTLLFLGTIVDP